jgi:hypothetical protein
MRRNPAWNEVRDAGCKGEMLGREHRQRYRKHQPAERHDQVDAVSVRQFFGDLDQADEADQRRRHIDPEHRRRHAERRKHQSVYHGEQLAAGHLFLAF